MPVTVELQLINHIGAKNHIAKPEIYASTGIIL